MCGIAGIISKKENFDFSEKIAEMAGVLKHRGPDGEGFFIDKSRGVYLGHRRLSIIDLSQRANQPLYNEDKSLALIFNGEIYNYVELQAELKIKGHKFATSTDSEVLLHGWEEWGLGLLDRVNGMFAFCIYDRVKNEMILARDNIGIKPLYYLETDRIFAFASESRAFYPLRDKFWNSQIDERVLEQMLVFQFVADRQNTIYRNVKKLPAGHFLHYKDGVAAIKPYWKLEVDAKYSRLNFEEAIEECDKQFNRSINWQLRSDVPVGILLSGGIDSSLVAAVARRYSQDVNTFTATFEHKLDERAYARRCAEHIGTHHTEFNIDPLSINNRIEEIIKIYDDLSSFDGAIFTIFLMAEKICQFGIKVLLVGEGADEIFGGYSWFGMSQAPFRFLPAFLRSSAYHYAVSRQYSGMRSLKHLLETHKTISSFKEKDIFRQISRFEILYQLPNHFLMKVDRGTMAYSLEARVPYLDKELVRFAYSLPAKYKIKGKVFRFTKNNEKFILRRVAEKYLPVEIYARKKRGFSIPMEQVLKSNKDKVRQYVLSSGSIARDFYSARQIEKMLDFKNVLYSPVHKQKEFVLWRLFLLEVWRRNVYMQKEI